MRFSIIIPLYNKEKSIRKTIQSVLNQSYTDFELIIVNDGSTDNSLIEAQSVQDDRIRIIDKPNGGVSSARNRGMEESTSDWMTFLDADDIMYPDALSIYKDLHEKYPDINVLIAATDSSKKKYKSTGRMYVVRNYYKANIYSELRTASYLLCADCICINKKCYKEVGGFSVQYKHGEDLEYWYRLSKQFLFVKIEKAISYYDMDAENRSILTNKDSDNSWSFFTHVFNNPIRPWTPLYEVLINGCKNYNLLFTKLSRWKRLSYFINNIYTISVYVSFKVLFKYRILNFRGEK